MKTIWFDHLACDLTPDNGCGQWEMLVSNNGVVLGSAYGPLPVPDKETLKRKAKYVADNLPVNLWSA